MPDPTIEDSTEETTDQSFDPRDSDSYNPVSQQAQEAKGALGGSGNSPVDKLESAGTAPQSTHVDNFTGKGKSVKAKGFIDRVRGNKKWLAGGGIAGLGIAVPLLILSAMPLKLEMYIQNITNLASAVPGYATQQRLEYLITRALAVRMLQSVNSLSEADAKLVFCENGRIGCSLFATYTTDYFERKLGITLEADANGRVRLGGSAQSWDISVGRGEDGGRLEGPMRRVQTHPEMRQMIKKEVYSKTKNVISRYALRELLMLKYGVKNWRGPPKVENKIDEFANKLDNARSNVKSTVVKATVGKISPRLALYLTCLQDSTTCDKLREKLAKASPPAAPDETDPAYQGDNGDDQLKLDEERVRTQEDILEGTSDVEDEANKSAVKKIITKRVLSAAGGIGAAVGILDMVFGVVGSLGDGAMEEIWYDMSSQTYIGFANEIAIINEKWKAGDLDSDTLAATFELFENAEQTPLSQAENGLGVDTSQGITVECNDGVDEDGNNVKALTKLEPGQLVCSDQQVVRDYTQMFVSNPALATLKVVADGWNGSVGAVIDLAGDAIGAFLGALPGFNELMSLIGGAVEPVVNWLVGLIFEPPETGTEATGGDNYLALSAGIRTSENALFEEGVNDDGTALGGAGEVLTSEQVAAITEEWQILEEDYYNSQPMIAKLFDVGLSGSFAQRMVASIPTSWSSFLGMPAVSFGQLFSGTKTFAASANEATINPFNLPMYGYAPGDASLTASPGVYTDEYCAASAEARKNSLTLDKSISPVKIYTMTDPCALEKLLVGAETFAEGPRDSDDSLKDVRSSE